MRRCGAGVVGHDLAVEENATGREVFLHPMPRDPGTQHALDDGGVLGRVEVSAVVAHGVQCRDTEKIARSFGRASPIQTPALLPELVSTSRAGSRSGS